MKKKLTSRWRKNLREWKNCWCRLKIATQLASKVCGTPRGHFTCVFFRTFWSGLQIQLRSWEIKSINQFASCASRVVLAGIDSSWCAQHTRARTALLKLNWLQNKVWPFKLIAKGADYIHYTPLNSKNVGFRWQNRCSLCPFYALACFRQATRLGLGLGLGLGFMVFSGLGSLLLSMSSCSTRRFISLPVFPW